VAEDVGADDDELPDGGRWRRAAGLFVLGAIEGPAAESIHALQRRVDPKLAAAHRPHLTLVGSSGVGPIAPDIPLARVRAVLTAIAARVAPIPLVFGAPTRFMQSEIVSLPLDPHGPLRQLHDRLASSGLAFGPVRFTFTPHVTLSFYPTLTRARAQSLLAVRVVEAAVLSDLIISATDDPLPPRVLATIPLGGESPRTS
jgi:2'-5' RNA ligase